MSDARVRTTDVPADGPKGFIWGACECCGISAVLELHVAGEVSRQICATCAEGADVRGTRAGKTKRFTPRPGGPAAEP
jgi:hypothetical protein